MEPSTQKYGFDYFLFYTKRVRNQDLFYYQRGVFFHLCDGCCNILSYFSLFFSISFVGNNALAVGAVITIIGIFRILLIFSGSYRKC